MSTLSRTLRSPWLVWAGVAAVSLLARPSATAQQPPAAGQTTPAAQPAGERGQAGTAAPGAQAGGRGRGGGGLFPQTEPDDTEGFVPLFDGKTLAG